ncbi:MAG: FAD-dependent oxidoreductase [Rhizobiales bacterium]|nr:FAD-dependent oxidoreductase [Hyphomicrobiales bacterium]NRB13630.1 FAD-dependent oxidoreductase [Hyphomicrobiales bacterium]
MTKISFSAISIARRQLLKTALMASLTAPFNRTFAADLSGKKILIIGAGMSGLSAARKLDDNGAEVQILEAKPHIGGRLRTDYGLGAPFELGAGWVHGPSANNPITQSAKNIDANLMVTHDASEIIYDQTGNPLTPQQREVIDDNWYDLLALIDDELEIGDTRSLYNAIKTFAPSALKDEGVMWALSAYTEFSKGGSIENISALYHDADEAFDGEDVILTMGYDKILAPLAKGLNIRLSTLVTDIEYGKNGVAIYTNKGLYKADYVICSLPLGILKSADVAFEPPLPKAHKTSINKIGFGSVTKIALKFDQAFWPIDTQYFGVQTTIKGRWNYWLNYRTFSQQNILLGLSMGDYAPIADNMNDADMQADALKVLRDVWGDAVGEVIDMRATHWSLDQHTLGAYSYVAAGCKPKDFAQLAKPIANRLFLAGEHTIFEYAGTLHGAYLSGIRAANQILAL